MDNQKRKGRLQPLRDVKRVRNRTMAFAVTGMLICIRVVCAAQPDIAAIGPVDAVSCKTKSIRVLGITFVAKDKHSAAAVCSLDASSAFPYVATTGYADKKGQISLASLKPAATEQYVSGATPIYLRGTVTAVDSFTGTVSISGAVVSSTDSLPSLGSAIELVGSQPLPGGVVLADRVVPLSSSGSGAASSSGSGIASSSGSGIASSSGSGIASSSGSGIRSSSGSGKASSSGSGIASSSGSGIASSSGSGVASSSGSGIASSSGSGIASSSGSGIRSSSGSGKASSSGSGVFSSSGSGK